MPSQLSVHVVHRGEMRVSAVAGDHTVEMDYPMGGGDRSALTPLQLLLASLAGCSGNTMALLLRRHNQKVSGVEVSALASRRDEHPTVLTDIALEFTVRGTGLDEAIVRRSLVIAEENLCPVWAMLKEGTPIVATVTLVEE
ncbi:MAG: OsmC family protein [Thermoleophilia bacterium]